MKVRRSVALLLCALLLLSLAGCGGSAKSEAAYDNAMPEAPAMQEVSKEMYSAIADGSESGSISSLPVDRKLIRTVRMEVETETLDSLLAAMEEKLASLEGYVQAREVYNGSTYSSRRYRHADVTLRIPAESLNDFVDHVAENANVVTSSETIDDVTTQYVDTESRVAALEIERDRLMELLAKAETMEDILTIESRLTDVRYELENFASQLRLLDNKVNYATVHLNITEVQEYTPVIEEEPTVWQQMKEGFARSLKDIGNGIKEFGIWFVVNLPYLVIWAAVLTGLMVLLRKVRFKRPVKKAPRPDANEKSE